MESLFSFFGNRRRKYHVPVEKAAFDFWEPEKRDEEEFESNNVEMNVKKLLLYLLPIFSMLAILFLISL